MSEQASHEADNSTDHAPGRRKRGQLLFAGLLLAFSTFLFLQLGQQTTWVENTQLFAQPAFWPTVSVCGMLGFTALHLWKLPRRRFIGADWDEGAIWLSSFEFAGWFLGYVFVVPYVGYLLSTLVFMALIVLRLGYRSRAMMWISLGFGGAVVVLFKGLLSVRIPGGAIYEYLPGALRSFFILNF